MEIGRGLNPNPHRAGTYKTSANHKTPTQDPSPDAILPFLKYSWDLLHLFRAMLQTRSDCSYYAALNKATAAQIKKKEVFCFKLHYICQDLYRQFFSFQSRGLLTNVKIEIIGSWIWKFVNSDGEVIKGVLLSALSTFPPIKPRIQRTGLTGWF